MIEQVTVYKLTCQGCGVTAFKEWDHTRDTRVIVRSFGWWCANEAQYIDHQYVWHIRCPACGPL